MKATEILFETLPYRISSSRYFGIILRRILLQWWAVCALLLVALVGATCYDLRFGIILLMVIFLILPMMLFFLYFHYALRPEAFYSVVEKQVLIHAQGIDCIYDEQRRQVLLWSDVLRVEVHRNAYRLYTGKYTYFYLSRSAFATEDAMNEFETHYLPLFIS